MADILVCREGEIADGGVRVVRSGEVEVGVIRHAGKYYAYRNLCPHQGGPACEGVRMPQVVDMVGKDGMFLGQKMPKSPASQQGLKLGEHLASGAPIAYRDVKRTMIGEHSKELEEALDEEIRLQTHCFLSEDCAEGLAAFFAKRKPHFRGH